MSSISSLFNLLILVLLLGFTKPDPDPLQDFCIADTATPQPFFLNGAPCINPRLAVSSHFTSSVLAKSGNTGANPFGFNVTLTNTRNLPGFNTQGLAMARIDIAANGLVPPHSHPRASEVTTLLKGALLVGFVDTSNRLFTQQLRLGDSFVFPKGLIHFLFNLDSSSPALAISGFNSQNPGAQVSALANFASKLPMPDEVVKKAFQINGQDLLRIRKNLGGMPESASIVQLSYPTLLANGREEAIVPSRRLFVYVKKGLLYGILHHLIVFSASLCTVQIFIDLDLLWMILTIA